MAGSASLLQRLALVSLHTSPLAQPGSGDAGGMNVYVLELARRLVAAGVEVDLLTRATSPTEPAVVDVAPGLRLRHVAAGPPAAVPKGELPALVDPFSDALLALQAPGGAPPYDLVHSHYWLSGAAALPVAGRWRLPLVHTMHTMATVKNATLGAGDSPEPAVRLAGERAVVAASDRLVASTGDEAAALVEHYDADPERVAVVPPGVDGDLFEPGLSSGGRGGARRRLGLPAAVDLLLFVGRLQPLKAPDVLLRAVAELLAREPEQRTRLLVVILGGASGSSVASRTALSALATELAVADIVRLGPPVPRPVLADWYRAADAVVVPSRSESFGLVALEAQACGTPVVAARVGGLSAAVQEGVTGVLVAGHEPASWALALGQLLADAPARRRLGEAGPRHADAFGWERTAARILDEYHAVLEPYRRAGSGSSGLSGPSDPSVPSGP